MHLGPRGAAPLIPEGAQKTPYIVCQSRLSPASDLNGTPKIWAYSIRRFIASRCTESVDGVFSSHNVEHLYPHEVPVAFAEFLRVLKPGGLAVITCPDLQSVCALVAEDKLLEPAYTSPAGPIAPLDILYGHRSAMAQGNLYMAHRCGFTQKVLRGTLQASGFKAVATMSRGYPYFDLWAVASKDALSEEQMKALATEHISPV